MIIFQELLLIILLPLILCRIRKDDKSNNVLKYNNLMDITKCNDEPFPSSPLRTLHELGICGTSDTIDTPHRKINCTMIDTVRDYSFSNYILDENQRQYRYEIVKNLTLNNSKFKPHNLKLIFITVVNYGYLFLFYNWLCSVKNNVGSLETIINSLIVVASDDDASMVLKTQGFNVLSLKEMVPPNDPKYMVNKEAPKAFGENLLALQKGMLFTLASDIVTLGYEFLLFDVDVIFKKDPRTYFNRFGHNIDFLITHDGRFRYEGNVYDIDGPLNSGIIYGKPSCRYFKFLLIIYQYS